MLTFSSELQLLELASCQHTTQPDAAFSFTVLATRRHTRRDICSGIVTAQFNTRCHQRCVNLGLVGQKLLDIRVTAGRAAAAASLLTSLCDTTPFLNTTTVELQ